jgi:PKD repeat protein
VRDLRRLVAFPVAVAALLLTAGTASAATFTIAPPSANPGQEITVTPSLTAAELLTTAAVGFQFGDEDPVMDTTAPYEAVKHTYATAGAKTITMRIDKLVGDDDLISLPFRVNAEPTASFTFAPTVPNVNQVVQFDARGSTDDVALPNAGYAWDFNADGSFDAVGQTVSASYASPGDKTVRLRVTDSGGLSHTVTRTLHVNRPPTALFIYTPKSPRAGERVDFTSISTDPDNPIGEEAWDLDGDGQYDDASGDTARRIYSTAGTYTVRLRVTDSRGRTDISAQSIRIAASPPLPAPTRLSPWPKIRIVGFASRKRTRIDLFYVRTTKGTSVRVLCRGKACPRKKATSTQAKGKLVRLRWLERRLRRGTRIIIEVTAPGRIGRVETIVLRKNKKPLRRERCLWPDETQPRKCSS